MASTRTFEEYFANRGSLPGEDPIEGDELLIMRSGTVFRGTPATALAYASMNANPVETVINTIDVWEPIGGSLDNLFASTNFTFDQPSNAYTYIGTSMQHAEPINVRASLSKAGGGDNIYEIGVFVNGSIQGTGMSVGASTALVGFVASAVPRVLLTGDVIDMRVRNLSGNSNVTVIDAQLTIGNG